MDTGAQSLYVLILAGYSLSLGVRLNTHAAPSLRNLRTYPRIQKYGTLQEYTTEPVLIGESFFRECLSPKPE